MFNGPVLFCLFFADLSSANSLNNQGTVFLDQEEYDNAQEKLEEAVSLFREIGDRWHYANAVNNLANVTGAGNRVR